MECCFRAITNPMFTAKVSVMWIVNSIIPNYASVALDTNIGQDLPHECVSLNQPEVSYLAAAAKIQ